MAKKNAKSTQVSSTQVMSAVASSLDFIKSQIGSDLLTAKNRGMIELDNDQLKKITSIIEGSITQSFFKSSGQIESQLK